MTKLGPLLLLVLVIYIFSPTLLDWVIHPGLAWYRPYVVWLLVVIVAFLLQLRAPRKDQEP